MCEDFNMDQTPPNSIASRKSIIVGSSVALVIGATLMILLHETAHAVTGMILGYAHPVQLPFAVDHGPDISDRDHIIALLAGPAFSLGSGVVGVVIDRIVTPFLTRPFWRMVWLWTIFTSIQEGLGYLQISGILQAGDTAQAFALLDAEPIAYILATTLGWICLPLTAWLFAIAIRPMSATLGDKRNLAVWPWMIGTGVLLVLMATYVLLSASFDPSVVMAVLAGALAVGVYAPMSMMFGTQRFGAERSPQMPLPATGGLILLVLLVVANLVLTRGWFWP